jgi:hypothetical protein
MDRGIMCFAYCCAGCGVYRRSGASTLVESRATRGFNGIFMFIRCLRVYEFIFILHAMHDDWLCICDAA